MNVEEIRELEFFSCKSGEILKINELEIVLKGMNYKVGEFVFIEMYCFFYIVYIVFDLFKNEDMLSKSRILFVEEKDNLSVNSGEFVMKVE